MRICLLSARFPPQRCGVGDYTYFLAGALGRKGHDVHVLTAAGADGGHLYPVQSRETVHRLANGWVIGGLPEILKTVKRIEPEVLLVQYTPHSFERRGLTLAVNLIPALLRTVRTIRVVTNFHELFIPFGRSVKHDLGALWQRAAALLLAFGSHGITVTVSEWQRRLGSMGVRKPISMIPVGSNIPLLALGQEERLLLRKEILDGPEGVLVLGFGAWHDRDMLSALSAIGKLKKHSRVKLLWIGGGAEGRLRTLIKDAVWRNGLDDKDVEWAGVLPHPRVSKLLAAGDFMILPFVDGVSSRRTSAVTALQHGLPLLTTRGSHVEPWFVHGKNSYLVPVGDREALENASVELTTRSDLRSTLAQGARDLFNTTFAWEVIAEQVSRHARA